MDKYVEMLYCGFEGFKVFVKNYLFVDDYVMFDEIRRLLSEVEMILVDVVENFMFNFFEEDVDKCFEKLVVVFEVVMEEVVLKKEMEVKIKDNEIWV